MSYDFKHEIAHGRSKSLLPIEITLVAWSVGLGVAMLVILAIVDKLHPAMS